MKTSFFLLFPICTTLSGFDKLSELFEEVTGYEDFNSRVNTENSHDIDKNYNERFENLIGFLQERRDGNLLELKEHLKELKEIIEDSLKNAESNVDRPVWPTCCGLNGDLSVFTPELKMSNQTNLKYCQAAIDPSSKTEPLLSLYETEMCWCLLYAESSSVNDDAFGEAVLIKMQELKIKGIQQLLATRNGQGITCSH